MADLLKKGADWLAAKFPAQVGQAATYAQGAAIVAITVTLGQSDLALLDVGGFGTSFHSIDVLIDGAELDKLRAAIEGFEPKEGDKITTLGRTYRATNIPGGTCFRYSDPYHTAVRVHTKQ